MYCKRFGYNMHVCLNAHSGVTVDNRAHVGKAFLLKITHIIMFRSLAHLIWSTLYRAYVLLLSLLATVVVILVRVIVILVIVILVVE
jgi:hypothetical protein